LNPRSVINSKEYFNGFVSSACLEVFFAWRGFVPIKKSSVLTPNSDSLFGKSKQDTTGKLEVFFQLAPHNEL